jgi:penicillin-binding protein 2
VPPAAEPIPELSPRSLEWVKRGLEQVVAHPRGTGYKNVRLDEVAIAGKTGTAEPGGGRADHAWFAGYVPAERPRVAFVVVLENAGPGGYAAGPLARKFVQSLLEQGLLGRAQPALPLAN